MAGYYDCTTLVAIKPVWAYSAALSVLFIVSANDDDLPIQGTKIPVLWALYYGGFEEPLQEKNRGVWKLSFRQNNVYKR